MNKRSKTSALRNFIFGVEDSLVSTVGLVSGVASTGMAGKTIVLTGVILVFVEAFSMAVGSLMSENSAEEYESKHSVPLRKDLADAGIMFVSYLVSGILVVLPYLLWSPAIAFFVSIAISLLALFGLGVCSAYFSNISKVRQGLLMCVLGGSAIVLGVVVGRLVNTI